MKTGFASIGLAAALASLSLTAPARAADMPEVAVAEAVTMPLDVAFGVKLATDYLTRSVTNSRGKPAIQGYVELQAFDWVYAGIWSSNVSFPARLGLSDPSSEIDLYGGVRHTFGAFTFDAGAYWYWYPGERSYQTDYYEVYTKPSVMIGDWLQLTGTVLATTDFANSGAKALYTTASAKVTLPNFTNNPDLGFYTSGEFGRQYVGTTNDGFNVPSYLLWNVGVGMTYKAATIDLRYGGSNLSKNECVGYAGARGWCGDRFVASIAFDTSLSKLK